jgi:hypothetical protein
LLVASCAARLDAIASAQRMWARAALARTPDGGATRAWLLLPGVAPPCNAALALLKDALSAGKELVHDARRRVLAALASLPPVPPAGVDAPSADGDAALSAGLQFLARAAALLAHARLCCAGDAFCACADAVLAECAAYAAAAHAVCQPQAAQHGEGGGGTDLAAALAVPLT